MLRANIHHYGGYVLKEETEAIRTAEHSTDKIIHNIDIIIHSRMLIIYSGVNNESRL